MIIATLLVKNDSDILVQSIEHQLNNNVDALIVTENNATSKTRSILDSYAPYILTRIQEPEEAYYQTKWVSRMARVAADYKPDWIIHCDADELWHNLKCLAQVSEDVVAVKTQIWRNYLPYSADEFRLERAVFYETPTERSWFGLGMQAKHKIIHRPNHDIEISQGNHQITGSSDLPIVDVVIHHYPIRTFVQFEQKVMQGGKAYELTDFPEYVGRHWRRWYKDYLAGNLRETFDKYIITPANIERAIRDWRIHGPSYF